ncbi:streptosactin maturase GggB [Streptococcus constellatus]|uniref:streptosactin maturase GggB n=1 Tax=Streptococcus constellatus TaxID=76860 RepID=UPI0015625EB8|nr:radical SAM protein [Streptococcus constellatus]
MLKEFKVNSKTYYFDSENFTLSTSATHPNSKLKKLIPKTILQKVVINISNSCNLSCSYCYADGGNYGMDSRIMNQQTANAIIEDLKRKNIKQINRLILFGREPFLNIKLFVYFIEKLSLFLKIEKIETVTNGTVLTSKIKHMITTYHPYLTVSLDGPEIVHDKLRGKGSHKKTIKFIEYLKEINYNNFEIASTYTRIHQKNGFSKDDIYQYFTDMNVNFNINNVFSKNKVLIVKEMELSNDKRKEFIDQSIYNIITNNTKAFISPVLYDVLISMIYKSESISFCDDINPENTVTYDVDGSKKLCFRFWGTHNNDKVNLFNNKNKFESCRECWCRGMCMECVANFIDGYSSIINENGEFLSCNKQELMEYCIYKIIKIAKHKEKLSKLVNNFERFIRYA